MKSKRHLLSLQITKTIVSQMGVAAGLTSVALLKRHPLLKLCLLSLLSLSVYHLSQRPWLKQNLQLLSSPLIYLVILWEVAQLPKTPQMTPLVSFLTLTRLHLLQSLAHPWFKLKRLKTMTMMMVLVALEILIAQVQALLSNNQQARLFRRVMRRMDLGTLVTLVTVLSRVLHRLHK